MIIYCLLFILLAFTSFYLIYIQNRKATSRFRIGYGFDSHPFLSTAAQTESPDRPLMLGGVKVFHDRSLHGHSDSDVVIHALIDALLGAAALDDIGQHFPETDTSLKNVDSRVLLRSIKAKLSHAGFIIGNIDITLMAHQPKLSPYRTTMRMNLAADLAIQPEQISVKFSSNNRLGFVGRQEGIAAAAIALIYSA